MRVPISGEKSRKCRNPTHQGALLSIPSSAWDISGLAFPPLITPGTQVQLARGCLGVRGFRGWHSGQGRGGPPIPGSFVKGQPRPKPPEVPALGLVQPCL